MKRLRPPFPAIKPPPDPFGQAAVALMTRMLAVGQERALEEEMASPTLPDDPDWCATIVAVLAEMEPAPPRHDPSPHLFRCPDCRDTGWVIVEDGMVEMKEGPPIRGVPAADRCRRCNGARWKFDREMKTAPPVERFVAEDFDS